VESLVQPAAAQRVNVWGKSALSDAAIWST